MVLTIDAKKNVMVGFSAVYSTFYILVINDSNNFHVITRFPRFLLCHALFLVVYTLEINT